MNIRYAADDLVFYLMSSGRSICQAHYIYNEAEAKERFSAVIQEVGWIVDALPQILSIRANIWFAVATSRSPFQVSWVGGDDYVILIDQRAFYALLTLCLRLQSLPPLSNLVGAPEVGEDRSFKGMYLIDIAKVIAFHSVGVEALLASGQPHIVCQAALTHIIGHEIAHVSHGHIDFKRSKDFEVFASTREERYLTLKTLEMDADSSATTSVFDVFEQIIGASLSKGGLPAEFDEVEFAAQVRSAYMLGMYVANIFHDSLSSNFLPRSYPIGYARFLTSLDISRVLFSRHAPQARALPDQVRKLLVLCFWNLNGNQGSLGHPIAENLFRMCDGGGEVGSYEPFVEAQCLAHLDPLHGRWSSIRGFLEKYQRGGVLAPANAPPK